MIFILSSATPNIINNKYRIVAKKEVVKTEVSKEEIKQNAQEITGISNERWHYRYVGKEAAKTMYEESLCLEEYLEKYCD